MNKVRKAWECPICLELCLPFRNPCFLAKSGHFFCGTCLEHLTAGFDEKDDEDAMGAKNPPCPQCKERFELKDIRPLQDNLIAWRALLSLYVECPLDECRWRGDAGDL